MSVESQINYFGFILRTAFPGKRENNSQTCLHLNHRPCTKSVSRSLGKLADTPCFIGYPNRSNHIRVTKAYFFKVCPFHFEPAISWCLALSCPFGVSRYCLSFA